MHPVLSEVLAATEAARADLLALIDNLSPGQWEQRGSDGGWTVGEVVGHLQLVEDSSVRALFRAFRTARDAGLGPETDTASRLGSLDGARIEETVRPLAAPPMVTPTDAVDLAARREKLEFSRSGLRKFAAEADGMALSQVKFPHPAIGEIDLYQWVLFIGQHERRHIAQIRRILHLA
ncbi:MAG: DinB family protein [Gemmatimonadetes bacterium]|nr:DinB family protein [Gemmatimonadota bacterium]